MILRAVLILTIAAATVSAAPKKKDKTPEPSPVDVYVQDALRRPQSPAAYGGSAGSLWSPAARLTDLGSDLRARLVDDIVTILVDEKASAVTTGATKTSRQSNVKSSVSAAGGLTRVTGPWANLAGASTATALDGSGSTSRETTLSTTLAARVTNVLPNGYLVVEAHKELMVNTERQIITVRGVVRPADLTPGDVVRSDHLAQVEVRINGKGVVGDAIRRPNFLYRLILGLLPF